MPANKRQLEHVDRRELYTSLEVRVQYLHSFLDFTAGIVTRETQCVLKFFNCEVADYSF
jgi:hypothetical protein